MKPWMRQDRQNVWHVFSRGVRQSPIFFSDEQRLLFLKFVAWAAHMARVDVLCFCLMDNHFHLLVKAAGKDLSRFMMLLLSRYARAVNLQMGSSGRLFESKFRRYRAKTEAWVMDRANYIHMNPVEAGIVNDPRKYRWSSLGAFLGGSSDFTALRPALILKFAGGKSRYRDMILATNKAGRTEKPLTNHLYQKQSGPRGFSREEISLLLADARKLHNSVVQIVNETPHLGRKVSAIRLLCSYLSKAWEVAPSIVMAGVLICSVKTVQYHRREGRTRIKRNRILKDLVDRIKDRHSRVKAA